MPGHIQALNAPGQYDPSIPNQLKRNHSKSNNSSGSNVDNANPSRVEAKVDALVQSLGVLRDTVTQQQQMLMGVVMNLNNQSMHMSYSNLHNNMGHVLPRSAQYGNVPSSLAPQPPQHPYHGHGTFSSTHSLLPSQQNEQMISRVNSITQVSEPPMKKRKSNTNKSTTDSTSDDE
mmetsp:Transcript_10802/g.16262  ORF Transcript_10802/g.16262 Transcript_10802/m.16262 type:complete len:175 (+) Transcript_10802:11-535(+)